jgi:hypothetical protein
MDAQDCGSSYHPTIKQGINISNKIRECVLGCYNVKVQIREVNELLDALGTPYYSKYLYKRIKICLL